MSCVGACRLSTHQVDPCLLAVGTVLEYRDLLAASGGSPQKSPKSNVCKEATTQLAQQLEESHSATKQVFWCSDPSRGMAKGMITVAINLDCVIV